MKNKPWVLVEVSGGVASVQQTDGVNVVLIDHDNIENGDPAPRCRPGAPDFVEESIKIAKAEALRFKLMCEEAARDKEQA